MTKHLNRRRFLQTSAATGFAAGIAPHTWIGHNSMTIGFGIITNLIRTNWPKIGGQPSGLSGNPG